VRGIARAFAQNPVFANIVLLIIFLAGFLAVRNITRETFPDFSGGEITVTALYPGADPAEVEEGVTRKIEDAIEGVAGVKRVRSESDEGFALAVIEILDGYDPRRVLDLVRNRVNSIATFPNDAEKPIIMDRLPENLAFLLSLSADVSERRLKRWAEDIKEELRELPEVSQVEIAGARDFEISIEVPEERLQAFGLTLADVVTAIRGSSFNLAAGTVRTEGEEVRLRTLGRKYTGDELGSIVVRALPTGEIVTLDRIAEIRDAFAEEAFFASLNGSPSVFILIRKTPQEDSILISDAVREFVGEKQSVLPPGTRIDVIYDMSTYLRSRIDLLLRNGLVGLLLVFLLVWTFLDFRLSFWVGMGMPISVAGGLAVMWGAGQTINMISLFGLIMVLGLIVDDAIVVGEAIYQKRHDGLPPIEAAVEGLGEVGWPVVAGVTTTMIALIPLAFVSGVMGRFVGILPIVVIACLTFSLIEVLLLFPAHLGHLPDPHADHLPRTPFFRRAQRLRGGMQAGLAWIIEHAYAPLLDRAVAWRYAALAGSIAAFLVAWGFVAGGILQFRLFGNVDGSILTATVELPGGTPLHVTRGVVERIEDGIHRVGERTETASGEPLVQDVIAMTGASLDASGKRGPNVGSVQVVLLGSNERGIASDKVMVEWEKELGRIPGAESLAFTEIDGGPGSRAIEVWLRGPDLDELVAASDEFMERLREFDGVYQVERSFRQGKREIRFELKPEARALGLTVADLASQLQARYFGHEAVRVQRGREDVRVKVRYPPKERGHLSTLDAIRIRTPRGHEVPLRSVATLTYAPGYSTIQRINGMRSIVVSSTVDSTVANPQAIVGDLRASYFRELESAYPGLRIAVQGNQREMLDSLGSLKVGFPMAIMGIFVLIAAVFRSYLQPVVILFTVPLGIFGALVAHLLMGLDLTMLSLFGMVALAGVAVNDSIVMVEAVNDRLRRGMSFPDAVRQGGMRRFRAVLLTTLTTVGGLAPLIMETDLQAQFLIPMAVSIAGGEAFGTVFTVLLVPVLLYILNDGRRVVVRLRRGAWPGREEVEPAYVRVDPVGDEPPVAPSTARVRTSNDHSAMVPEAEGGWTT